MPLCSRCRDKLAARPLPAWTIVSSLFLAIVMVFAFARFPAALGAAVAFERGQRAEEQGNYEIAKQQYALVVAQYPGSTEALARLAISQCETMDLVGAVATLQKLEGREASVELIDEVNQAISEVEIKLERTRQRRQ